MFLDWSSDSLNLIVASKDLTARIYHRVCSRKMATTVLTGHRDRLMGAFFSQDANCVYSVARDGGIFTWKYQADEIQSNQNPQVKKQKNTSPSDEENNVEEEENDSDSNIDEDSEIESVNNKEIPSAKKSGKWTLAEREFLWDPETEVSSASFNVRTNLLVVGFTRGVFGLYEMPGCVNVHRLSVSTHSLDSVSINPSGEWLAVASSQLGQLLVWEWQSETFVLKQQGHLFGLSAVDFSPGQGGFVNPFKNTNCLFECD